MGLLFWSGVAVSGIGMALLAVFLVRANHLAIEAGDELAREYFVQ